MIEKINGQYWYRCNWYVCSPNKVQYNSGKVLKTHTLLDSCSQGTFILKTLINNLDVKRQ